MDDPTAKHDVKPFIRKLDDETGSGSTYLVGLETSTGEIVGPVISLTEKEVQYAIFSSHHTTVMCDLAGQITSCPSNIVDDVLDLMFQDGRLRSRPLDELVDEAIGLSVNEPIETMIADLAVLQRRLEKSLARVREAAQELQKVRLSNAQQRSKDSRKHH